MKLQITNRYRAALDVLKEKRKIMRTNVREIFCLIKMITQNIDHRFTYAYPMHH